VDWLRAFSLLEEKGPESAGLKSGGSAQFFLGQVKSTEVAEEAERAGKPADGHWTLNADTAPRTRQKDASQSQVVIRFILFSA